MESQSNIEKAILELAEKRGREKTFCPSEVARALFADGWRDKMESVRAAAKKLVEQHLIVITQKGQIVDPSTAKGAIRIRKK